MPHAHPPREFALELLGVPPGGQPHVERGVDQVDDLLGVEDAPGARHRRATGFEGPAGEGDRVVLAHQLEDFRSQAVSRRLTHP